eukprot:6485887-Amphidinium_carterae.2
MQRACEILFGSEQVHCNDHSVPYHWDASVRVWREHCTHFHILAIKVIIVLATLHLQWQAIASIVCNDNAHLALLQQALMASRVAQIRSLPRSVEALLEGTTYVRCCEQWTHAQARNTPEISLKDLLGDSMGRSREARLRRPCQVLCKMESAFGGRRARTWSATFGLDVAVGICSAAGDLMG